LGLGHQGEEFNRIRPWRYHRIVIMTDRPLWMAPTSAPCLSHLTSSLSEKLCWKVATFIACPPLLQSGARKNHTYCYNEQDLKPTLDGFGGKAISNPAFQGLGENECPSSSWETTMDANDAER